VTEGKNALIARNAWKLKNSQKPLEADYQDKNALIGHLEQDSRLTNRHKRLETAYQDKRLTNRHKRLETSYQDKRLTNRHKRLETA